MGDSLKKSRKARVEEETSKDVVERLRLSVEGLVTFCQKGLSLPENQGDRMCLVEEAILGALLPCPGGLVFGIQSR